MKRRGHFYPLRIKGVSEVRQGLIFYLCRCYADLSEHKRLTIDELYKRIGGDNAAALRDAVGNEKSFDDICGDGHGLTLYELCKLRKRFYMEFPLREILG